MRVDSSERACGSWATPTRCVDTVIGRRSRSRERHRCSSRVVPNQLTRVGEIVISGTEEISPTTVRNSLIFRAGRHLPPQRGAREPAQPVRVEPLPAGDGPGARDVRQREDGARPRCARRRCTRRASAPASTRSTTSRPRDASRTTTCSAARGGSTRRPPSATSSRNSAQRLGHLPAAAGGPDRSRATPTTSCSRPGRRTCSSRSPRSCGGPKNSLAFGGFAQRRSVPAVVIDRGYGGNAHVHARARPARAGQPELPVRGDARRGRGRVLLRELRRVRHHHHQRRCARTSGCRPVLASASRSTAPTSPSRRTRGYTATRELEHASEATVSDYRVQPCVRARARPTRGSASRNAVLASAPAPRVRPAASAGRTGQAVLHPRKRFYAGGSQSVRGYGENQLGPRILTLPHGYLINALTAAGATVRRVLRAIRFCDPNTAARLHCAVQVASATTSSRRARSAARRWWRRAWSTASHCRSSRTSAARCSWTAPPSASASSIRSAGLEHAARPRARHWRDHAGLRHPLLLAGRPDPRGPGHQPVEGGGSRASSPKS